MKNAFYAQSGGVTSVINATAAGLIQAARARGINVLAGKNGILGALNEELIDTSLESDAAIEGLKQTPGGAFGSCRHKMKSPGKSAPEFERLFEVFKAHDISCFFYNGGGDSQDTTNKVFQMSQMLGYPLTCIGIPKTVDNDLPITDNCPGFGSVAKYVAVSIREAAYDVMSMSKTSTKVFVMEVMGRHAGWIAAASGLAAEEVGDAPHIILLPEISFNEPAFLKRVDETVQQYGYCVVCVSEGLCDASGEFLINVASKDAFGHAQLGGVGPIIAEKIKQNLGYKYHWAVADYLQRSARHIASQTDLDQAYALGKAAIEHAVAGTNNVMLTIERAAGAEYAWQIGTAPLEAVANVERTMPAEYITDDGFHITQACRDYLLPLIQGEAYPTYKNGLPEFVQLRNELVKKKLEAFA